MAGDESFAEDPVAVNNVGGEVCDIGLDVEADNVGGSIDAPLTKGMAGEFCEFGCCSLLVKEAMP